MNNIKAILCGWLIAMAASSAAQANNMYIGPEGGPGLALLWGSNEIKANNRVPIVSGAAGYAFQYNFTKILSLRTDISYQRTGVTYYPPVYILQVAPNAFNFVTHVKEKFDYITLPILLRATFGKKIYFFVNVGPYFGAQLKETTTLVETAGPTQVSNNTSTYKRFDTGITEGIGFLIPIGYMFAISFEARDYTGLYNINESQLYYSSTPVYHSTSPIIRNNSTDFIFSFIYKLVVHKGSGGKPAKDKSAESY